MRENKAEGTDTGRSRDRGAVDLGVEIGGKVRGEEMKVQVQ